MQPDENLDPGKVIACISDKMLNELDTGAMARLRRLDVDGPGPTDFWDLMRRCRALDCVSKPDETSRWMALVKIMATLTGKGAPGTRGVLHEDTGERAFGAVLCDGGRKDWPSEDEKGEPRPFVSEKRLARFLSRPPENRADDLLVFARMIASRRALDVPLNCLGIYWLLRPKSSFALRKVASSYYRRLDSAQDPNKEDKAA